MQKIFIGMIHLYQKIISPYVKSQCKFYPTCSQYAELAIKKYGCFNGIYKTFIRLLSCHPFSENQHLIDWP